MEFIKKNDSEKAMTMKEKMILLIAGGVLLMILFIPGGKSTDKSAVNQTTAGLSEKSEFDYLESYTKGLEEKLGAILSGVEGIGKMKIMITLEASEEYIKNGEGKKTIMPRVSGVVVSCEGGGSPVIEEQIVGAVQALFSIESHKIKVLKMK